MLKISFKALEITKQGDTFNWLDILPHIKYDNNGLIPAIAQQYDTKEVLMMAWMDEKSLLESLETGRVCYWSRSRKSYWRKGEESGQIQLLKSLTFDCDGDTILLQVDQTGPACHTGRKSCFYSQVNNNKIKILSNPIINPQDLYKK